MGVQSSGHTAPLHKFKELGVHFNARKNVRHFNVGVIPMYFVIERGCTAVVLVRRTVMAEMT